MAHLQSISVTDTDLQAVRPDIPRYLFEGQADHSVTIDRVKRQVYREIKVEERALHPELTDAELNERLTAVKDYPEETPLKDRIVKLTLAEIMKANSRLDEAEMYQKDAESMPLEYFVDLDADSDADPGEARQTGTVTFSR
ncbi:MAG: hypothetical protein K9N34_03655 [Candidatus Marinimicrobia bacterium]|nr:hypothetical protein [Candidatus Neomarinimicrobiota bacterium]MCF7839790.1 hypothetical protein [Candidatus Neomarinimicrobiota bacterium]